MGFIHDNGSNFGESDEAESDTEVRKLKNSMSELGSSFGSIGSHKN